MIGPVRSWSGPLFAMILALGAQGCTEASVREGNYDRCLKNDRACDMSALNAQEKRRLADTLAQQHFQDCMARLRCNETLLDAREREAVRQSVAQMNYQSCLRAEADCDERLLTDEQRAQVTDAGKARNREACLAGLVSCRDYELTAEEQAAARDAYTQRNFSGCMNTVGTLVQCNPEDLTPEQRASVEQRNRAVNYFLCSTGAFGCDQRLLTDMQRAHIQSLPR